MQKKRSDSLKAVTRHRTDSLNFIRNYKQSKHYQDSVENARQQRAEVQKAKQQRINDSLLTARKHVADSIMTARRNYSDSIKRHNEELRAEQQRKLEVLKLERKQVSDSLAAVRAYKESRHYKDSVTRVREERKTALAKERKHTSDSLRAIQKARTDSTVAARKVYNDSVKTVMEAARNIRMQQLDSLKAFRAARADSLAKVREARAALRKQKAEEKEKANQDKKKLALEIKIKKKQDKYTNEDMRKKKWTLPRKVVQNTFTRYNYYFNANKKMEEAIGNMVRSNTDNYDSLIALFPFDPDRDSTKMLSDMDTIIRKASLGIQIHDPRAKWQDDLYLLVGQAYYYKGDYQNAGAAFKQIVSQAEIDKKEKAKKEGNNKADRNKPTTYSEPEKTGIAGALEHKSAKNDAMLWLSRTLTQNKKEGYAQTLLDMMRNDALFPERLNGKLALEQAFIDLNRSDYNKAATSLSVVSADNEIPKWLRLRANFLNGQLLQQQLHYAESDQYFKEVLKLNPSLEMEFYARKNIAANSINYGSNTLNASDMLDRMASDDKFRPYYDQIYFAMGKAALKNKQNDKAMASFKKSVELSQNNKKQKGLSFAALGDEYYARSDYANAKRSYDSATTFLTTAQDPVYSLARQRALALDKVAVPGNEVKEQDSLIHLASLSEKDQRGIIRDYIRALEKRMADSAFMAQNGPANNAAANMNNNQGSQTWYFANPNLMKQGQNDFKQKWGNRPLKDNWRRSSASSNDFAATPDTEEGGGAAGNNLPDEDSLYAAIPHTPEQMQKANERAREGLFNLAKAYYTYLEDYGKATATFDTLDRRYPDHKHQAEELYLKYLINMRQNQPGVAAQYNSQLQSKYPDSEWAKLLKGAAGQTDEPGPFAGVTPEPGDKLSNFYDDTYALLIQRQYNEVLNRVQKADEQYKNQGDYRNKFNLMKAIATAGMGDYPQADTMLRQFVAANPSDPLVGWANAVLAYLKNNPKQQNMNNLQPGVNNDPLDPKVSAGLEYDYKPGSTHFVIIGGQADAKFAGLRSGISDYNLMKAGKENITVGMATLDAGKSIIICKEFKSAAEAKKYMNEIRNVNVLFREFKPGDYDIMLISSDNFPRLFVRKDFAEYKAFYNKNYK